MRARAGLAVERLERTTIRGATQWALVRGRDATSPVPLLVQAGSGFETIHEAQAVERALGFESRCRVAYWDRRGAGKSHAVGAGAGAQRLDDLVLDVLAVLQLLATRLGVAAPPHLTERYFRDLEAPGGMRWVHVEDSAHMPHREEPQRLRAELLASIEEDGIPPGGATWPGTLDGMAWPA